MSCIQETCQNPCVVSNPCERSQECSVTDSSVGRPVVACSCPDYNIVNDRGYCQPGMISISNLVHALFKHLIFLSQLWHKMNVKLMRTVRIHTVAIKAAVKMHVGLQTADKMPTVIASDMKGIVNVSLVLLVILSVHVRSVSIYNGIL